MRLEPGRSCWLNERMTRRSLLILAALLLAPLAGGAQQPPPAAEADAAQLEGWLRAGKKLTVVDARSDAEYLAGHIPGALGIPAERTAEEGWRLPSDKTVPIVYYCRGPG
jgi:3-mercaptopyruvate sulfurtransferase SseA